MELNLGGDETVENPSVEEVRHYLKYMSVESPFVILSDGDAFIQALHELDEYRVEYKIGECKNGNDDQFYCQADYELSCDLFASFLAGRDDYKTATEWKLLKLPSISTTPNPQVVLIILCILGAGFIAIKVWEAFN